MRSIWVGCRASPAHVRACRGRRSPELGPRPPRLLRLGDGSPAARVRYRPRTPRPHRCSPQPPQLRPLRRTAPRPQIPPDSGWARAYNTAAAIRQGAKTDTNAKWSSPNSRPTARDPIMSSYLIPAPPRIRGHPGRMPSRCSAPVLYLDVPPDRPSAGVRRCVSVQRCKHRANTHDVAKCRSICQRGCRIRAQQNPPRTSSPKATFRPPFNDSKWSRLPDTKRVEIEVESSR